MIDRDAEGTPTPGDASEQLAVAERASARGEQRVDYRVFGWLELGGAAAAAALFARVLLTASEQYEGTSTGMLIVLPVLLASGLIRGLLERFGLRPLFPARVVVIILLALMVPLAGLVAQIFFGVAYPSWLGILAGVVIVGVLGGRGASHLHRARGGIRTVSMRVPETLVVRISTAALGVVLGAAVVLVPLLQWPYLILIVIALLFVWTFPTPFGLMQMGTSWRERHWISVTVAMVVLYALLIIDAVWPELVTAVALPAGIIAAAPLVLSTLWPDGAGDV